MTAAKSDAILGIELGFQRRNMKGSQSEVGYLSPMDFLIGIIKGFATLIQDVTNNKNIGSFYDL